MTLTNGRFDGTGSDGYNGQSGKVKVRSLGTITVKASWGTEPTDYTWSYVDLTARPIPVSSRATGPTSIGRTW